MTSLNFGGVPVILASAMDDGTVILAGDGARTGPMQLFLGTHPTPIKHEARLIVRRGLADVLAYLGEDPEWLPTHEQFMDALRSPVRAASPPPF